MSVFKDEYRIAVETQPTWRQRPVGFGVFSGDKVVAFLSEDKVRQALAEFDDMKKRWEEL